MGWAGRILGALLLSMLPGGWIASAAGDTGDSPAATAPLSAEERTRRLDSLFAALQSGPDEGRRIEVEILRIWHTSGNTEVDRLMGLTLLAMNSHAYRLALHYLDMMVELKPDFAEGWNKRATVYFLIDDFTRSMQDIERTLALEPRHFGALAGIGMIMVKLGDKRRALDAFRKALAVNPNSGSLRQAVSDLEADLSRDL